MNDTAILSATVPATDLQEFLILAGALLLAALVAFILIALFRKNGTHRHHRHGKSHKKRRRRREQRRLNPTLAQTGGLPPIRTEAQPPGQTPLP